MTLPALIQAIEAAVPPDAPAGTRHRVEAVVTTGPQAHAVSIAMRIDPQGRRRETWLCDGVRVEPPLLKRLTCAEQGCEQARAAQQAWQDFLQRRARGASATPVRAVRRRGETEPGPTVLRSGALEVEARPARFPVYVACPNEAHPPQAMALRGLDVFEGGEFVVGGLQAGRSGGRPRVDSPTQVQALLDLSRDLTEQWLGRAATGAAS